MTCHRLRWALAAGFVLRLSALFWPVVSDDEAIYDTMAQVVRAGGVMYVDTVDHKPPGLVYTYAALQDLGAKWLPASVVGHTHGRMLTVHMAGALAAVCTAWLLFAMAKRVGNPQHAWAAAALYGLCTLARCPYDGLVVNGELLMNLPTAAAVALVMRGGGRSRNGGVACDIAAGVLLGVAGLFKWQALATGLAFPCLAWAAQKASGAPPMPPGRAMAHSIARALSWGVGLMLPLALTAGYFARHHALAAAWQWGLLFNLHYIGDGPTLTYALTRFGMQLLGVVLPSAWLFWGAWRGLRDRENRALRYTLGLWTLLACGCVAIGGRFFGHYFVQLDLPLALLAAGPMGEALARGPRWRLAGMCAPAFCFTLLALSPQRTRAVFDPQDPDWPTLGAAVAHAVAPDETLFVWGNAPLMYAYADRRPGTRFVFCNYMTGLSPATPSETDPNHVPTTALASAWPMLMADLNTRRPTWILDTAAAGWKGYGKFPMANFPELSHHVAEHYEPRGEVGGATLWHRRSAPASL